MTPLIRIKVFILHSVHVNYRHHFVSKLLRRHIEIKENKCLIILIHVLVRLTEQLVRNLKNFWKVSTNELGVSWIFSKSQKWEKILGKGLVMIKNDWSQYWVAPLGSHWSNRTIEGSLFAPSMNSSRDNFPSAFLSICRKIFSVRFSGVDSSSGIFITDPTIL